MDTWDIIMWVFLIIALTSVSSVAVKLKGIEHKLKRLTADKVDTTVLANMLLENVDNVADITFYEECEIYIYKYVKIKDIDESWVLLEEVIGKKTTEILARIDSIKAVKIINKL